MQKLFFNFFSFLFLSNTRSGTKQQNRTENNISIQLFLLFFMWKILQIAAVAAKWERSFGKAERVGGSTVSNKTADGQGSGNGKHTTPDKCQRKISFARWCNEGLYLSTHAYIYMYLQVSVAVSVSVALSLTVSADVAASMSQIQWLKSENHR